MGNALMIIGSDEFALMERQAKIIVESGLLPKSVNTWQKAVVIMMQGRELGIGAMASLRGIDVIQGTPSVKPQLMLALIERTGQLEDMTITDDGQKCAVTMTRRGRSAHTETFSMEDAKRMKTKEDGQVVSLSEKFNWRGMPEVMRKWRAIAACARVVFPDVVLGLYTQDELGEGVVYDDSGEIVEGVIEAPFVPQPISAPAPAEPPAPVEDPREELNKFLGPRDAEPDERDVERETPPAASENGNGYDPRTDDSKLTSLSWEKAAAWLVKNDPRVKDVAQASGDLKLGLQEAGKLDKDIAAKAVWPTIYGLKLTIAEGMKYALDHLWTKYGAVKATV